VLTILAQTLKLDREDWWKSSRLAPQLVPVAKALRVVAGERLRSLGQENGN
jgi:hypothetical protein